MIIIQATPNGDNRVTIGTTTQCRVGIGANSALRHVFTGGGTNQFGLSVCNETLAAGENHWRKNDGRIFERANALIH